MTQRINNIEQRTNERLDAIPQTITDTANRAVIDALNRPSVIAMLPTGAPILATPPQAQDPRVWFNVDSAFITWDNPYQQYRNHGQARIFRNIGSNNFDEASQIGQSEFVLYIDTTLQPAMEYHYWVVFVSDTNIVGQPAYAGSGQLGEIDAGQVGDNILNNLLARHGTLDTALIRKGDIFDLTINNEIRSQNYVADAAGWRVSKDGDVDLNDANVRGNFLSDLQSDQFSQGIDFQWRPFTTDQSDWPSALSNAQIYGMTGDQSNGDLIVAFNPFGAAPNVVEFWRTDSSSASMMIRVTIPYIVTGSITHTFRGISLSYDSIGRRLYLLAQVSVSQPSGPVDRVYIIREDGGPIDSVLTNFDGPAIIDEVFQTRAVAYDRTTNNILVLGRAPSDTLGGIRRWNGSSWGPSLKPPTLLYGTNPRAPNHYGHDSIEVDRLTGDIIAAIPYDVDPDDRSSSIVARYDGTSWGSPIRLPDVIDDALGSNIDIIFRGHTRIGLGAGGQTVFASSGHTVGTQSTTDHNNSLYRVFRYSGARGGGWRIQRDGAASFDAASVYSKVTTAQLDAGTRQWSLLWNSGDMPSHISGSETLEIPYFEGSGLALDDFDAIGVVLAPTTGSEFDGGRERWGITTAPTQRIRDGYNVAVFTAGTDNGDDAFVIFTQERWVLRLRAFHDIVDSEIGEVWGIRTPR